MKGEVLENRTLCPIMTVRVQDRHPEVLDTLVRAKIYLFVVGIFIISRNNRINQKLELTQGKLYSPGHALFLTSRNGS